MNARRQDGSGVFWYQRRRLKRHLPQEQERRGQLWIERRRLEIVKHTLSQCFIERDRRDRGVGIRSKLALIEPRDKCRK